MGQHREWRLRGRRFFYQLKLSDYRSYFKRLDLKKLFVKFQQVLNPAHGKEPTSLSLSDMDLTDSDLRRLGEAGWLDDLTKSCLINNPRLTAEGVICIGRKSSHLSELNLSHTHLTDDDLRRIAESGCFNHVRRLLLCKTPNITGKGLECVGKMGFPNLERLDISDNTQFTGPDLQGWIGCEGFANLKELELRDTNLTEKDLEQMIEKSAWVRKLEGLDLQTNKTLCCFPPNILELTNIKEIVIDRIDAVKSTSDFIKLFQARKIKLPNRR